MKKRIIIISIIIVLVVLGIIGYIIYKNYQNSQDKVLEEKISTVSEVNEENLKVEYNKEYTNKELEISLSTTTEYDIYYKLNDEEQYMKYEKPILLQNNSNVHIKYSNEYGTFSKEDYIIEIKNIDKESPKIVNKKVTTTTSELTVEIEVTDNLEVEKVEASIDNKKFNTMSDKKYTFKGLKAKTEYTVYIKVTDKVGNVTEDKITGRTEEEKVANQSLNSKPTKNETTSNNTSSSSNSNSSSNNSTKTNGNASSNNPIKTNSNASTNGSNSSTNNQTTTKPKPKPTTPTLTYDNGEASEIIQLMNEKRVKAGLSKLVVDTELTNHAKGRAMAWAKNYIANGNGNIMNSNDYFINDYSVSFKSGQYSWASTFLYLNEYYYVKKDITRVGVGVACSSDGDSFNVAYVK